MRIKPLLYIEIYTEMNTQRACVYEYGSKYKVKMVVSKTRNVVTGNDVTA